MKKISLFVLAIIFSLCSAKAVDVLAPNWSDICPKEYVDAKKVRFDKDQRYWYDRRIQFNDALENCRNTQADNLKACYAQVKADESKKNKEWNAYVQEYNERLNKRDEALEENLPVFNGPQSMMNMFNIPNYNYDYNRY